MPGANWGATAAELAASLPCDELDPSAPVRCDRAVSVSAPAPVVFRRLCQLRVAPYSYDLIDNLGRRSPRGLTPGLEDLEAGQRFMTIFRLASFVVDDHITLRSGRVVVTYSVRPDGAQTRLVARLYYAPPGGRLGTLVLGNALAVGDLVMMRRQLLNLRDLAEADPRGAQRPAR